MGMFCNVLLPKILLSKLRACKYRDRTTIIADILDTVKRAPKGETKTSIMRSANLNSGQAKKYIDMLLICSLIRAEDPIQGAHEGARYKVTTKGLTVMTNIEMVMLALQFFYQKPV